MKSSISEVFPNFHSMARCNRPRPRGCVRGSTTKETVSKYYWASNEPDDPKYTADEDCVEMGPNYLMGWNDAPCDRHVGVLCEYG